MAKTDKTMVDDKPNETVAATQSSRKRLVFKIAVPIIAIVLILVAAYPFYFGSISLPPRENGDRYAALEQKVADLTAQLQAYQETSSERFEAVQEAQSKVEQDLAHVTVPALASHDQQVIEELKAKVEELEAEQAKRQDQVAKIPETLSLFEKLHDRMQGSKPFDRELNEAKILFNAQDEDMQKRVQVLEAYGKEGVLTVEQLAMEFKPIAKELMNLSIPEDIPWYMRVAQRVRNLVIIRKQGQELDESAPVDERIDGVLYLLEIGNIEGALSEAEYLPQFNLDSYNKWRLQAEKRLYIEQSLPIMEAHALAHVLSGNQESKPKGE